MNVIWALQQQCLSSKGIEKLASVVLYGQAIVRLQIMKCTAPPHPTCMPSHKRSSLYFHCSVTLAVYKIWYIMTIQWFLENF